MATTQISLLSEEELLRSFTQTKKRRRKAKLKRIKRGILPWAVPLGYKRMQRADVLPIQRDAKVAPVVKLAFRMLGRQDETLQSTLAKLTFRAQLSLPPWLFGPYPGD